MGSVGALKLDGVMRRVRTVIAVELITAARALQFLIQENLAAASGRRVSGLSAPLQELVTALGEIIDLSPADRPLTEDIEKVTSWMKIE